MRTASRLFSRVWRVGLAGVGKVGCGCGGFSFGALLGSLFRSRGWWCLWGRVLGVRGLVCDSTDVKAFWSGLCDGRACVTEVADIAYDYVVSIPLCLCPLCFFWNV